MTDIQPGPDPRRRAGHHSRELLRANDPSAPGPQNPLRDDDLDDFLNTRPPALSFESIAQLANYLRTQVTPAGWMSAYVPDGALFHYGIVLGHGDRPETLRGGAQITGGSYYAEIKRIRHDTRLKSIYANYAPNPLYGNRMYTPSEIDTLHDILFHKPYSQLDKSEYASVYGKGTSLVLQAPIFAPFLDASGQPDFYKYEEVREIGNELTELGITSALYANIGAATNTEFFPGDIEYNFKYAMEMDKVLLGIPAPYPFAIPGITPSQKEFFSAVIPIFTKPPPPTHATEIPSSFANRYLYHAVLDVTRKDVVEDLLRSIRYMVNTFSDIVEFLVGAEFFTYVFGPFGGEPAGQNRPAAAYEVNDCRFQPTANFRAELTGAFQSYLEFKEFVSLPKIVSRWGLPPTSIMSFMEIDPAGPHSCLALTGLNLPKAVEDYLDFLDHLHGELSIAQYREAKALRPQRWFPTMSYNHRFMEHAWLHSDYPGSGDFYAKEGSYYARLGRVLNHYANMARMGGRPSAFPICSPPSDGAISPCENPATMRRNKVPEEYFPRCISKDHFRMFFRDLLTARLVNTGYQKGAGNLGFWGSDGIEPTPAEPKTLDAYLETLEDLDSIQSELLTFMTPYQRIVLHLDRIQLSTFDSLDPNTQTGGDPAVGIQPQVAGTRLAGHLVDYLDERHYPFGIFSGLRVLQKRLFSRKLIERSVLLSPFHHGISSVTEAGSSRKCYELEGGMPGELIELMDEYCDLVQNGMSAALAFTDCRILTAMDNASLLPSRPIERSVGSVSFQEVQWRIGANCFLWAFLSENDAIQALPTLLPPFLDRSLFKSTRPVHFDPDPGESTTDGRSTLVTDGLNYVFMVSNMNTGSSSLAGEIVVDRKISTGLGQAQRFVVTSEPDRTPLPRGTRGGIAKLTLRPKETRILYLKAVFEFRDRLGQSELMNAIMNTEMQLGNLDASGFDVADGLRLVGHLKAIDAARYPERVLAGLVRVRNMLFLNVSRGTDSIRIDGITYFDEPINAGPALARLEIQILHVLNGHEEKNVLTTSATPFPPLCITIEAPQETHYDFKLQRYRVLADATSDPVELHIYDPKYETHTFKMLEASSPLACP